MTNRERVLAALRGAPVDRVPLAFWLHDFAAENDVASFVAESLRLATTFGWDYPALRSLFERKCIPHTSLHSDPYQPLSDSDAARLDDVITAAETRMEARHG